MGRISIESTYKARDVEEIVDIYFYRRLGFAFALLAQKLGITPNAISVVGMIIGVISGHFFFYDDLRLNLVGVLLWVIAQALDGADGQLARMTKSYSRLGRMLDGISDTVKFTSVYFHLGLRLVFSTGMWWTFLIAAVAGIMHSYQSGLADYFRNAYLFFVYSPKKAEIDSADALQVEFDSLRWTSSFVEKALLGIYLMYTRRQERWAPVSDTLQVKALERFGTTFPDWLKAAYRRLNKPLLRYYNALTTNTRMIVFYFCLIFDNLYVFFAFELVVLNLVMYLVIQRQKQVNEEIDLLLDEAQVLVEEPAELVG